MAKVLLIDDDVELEGMLGDYLAREGFEISTAANGEDGVAQACSGNCSLVVLDVMMPRMGGVEVLKRIRAQSRIPVLMLTAKGDDADRIIGLELGADDYVAKPCTPRELLARIRAILRRTESPGQDSVCLVAGPLSMWPAQRRAEWEGKPIELTSTEYNLLEILAKNAGRVVTKADLSEQGLGRPLARFDRSIDVHMSSLRHKIGSRADGSSHIQTVYRQGYQFVRE
ncbi:MAG: response regulator transcription factor [Burkholderiales bacterium]|nr:response regulator transcription factor [Burkholderiales bacterium]